MSKMELTPIQREILSALVGLYRERRTAIRGEEIAEVVKRNPGTVRNQMQTLKILGLVEGVPGPRGGYRATDLAYSVLSIEPLKEEAKIPIYRNGRRTNAIVDKISFTTPRHPGSCIGTVKLIGDAREFEIGDKVKIGPTAVNKLVIYGEVVGRDDIENVLVCSITEMISLPRGRIAEYLEALPAISKDDPPGKAAELAGNGGVLIKDGDRIVGVVEDDVIRWITDGESIMKAARRDCVDSNATFPDALREMCEKRIGCLLVRDGEKIVGAVTLHGMIRKLMERWR